MKNKIFPVLLLAIVASTNMLFAEKVKIGSLYYELDATTLTAKVVPQNSSFPYWSTNITTVNIPASISYSGKTYSVTSIEANAFYGCSSLVSVNLPNSVTSIGEYAFNACTCLISVTIPNSVTEIGSSAFSSCTGLTTIKLSNALTSISDHMFTWCESLTSIEIPNSIMSIEHWAFTYCSNLSSVKFGNNVTSIGMGAFASCSSLTAIEIPNSVTSIGGSAFEGCSSITTIIVENENSQYDSRDSCNAIIETYSNTIVVGCKNTIIPKNVTCIGEWAFARCSGLTFIDIPKSVTRIETGAFSSCSSLTSIEIHDRITSIGDRAFTNCSSLTLVTINSNFIVSKTYSSDSSIKNFFGTQVTNYILGEGIANIGSYAFSGCSDLTTLTLMAKEPPILNNDAFVGCTNLDSIYVPCESFAEYLIADSWENFAQLIQYNGERFSVEVTVADSVMGKVIAPDTVCDHTVIEILAEPYAGFRFLQWSDSVTDNPRTLIIVSDTALKAEFEVIKYILSLNANDTIMGRVYGAGAYTLNTQVHCFAIPNDGFKFVSWNDGVTDNPYIITISGDKALTAMFQPVGEGLFDAENRASLPRKVIENGKLFILLPDGQRFNVLGENQ